MKFIVIEIQKFPEGGMSTPAYAYDNRASAEAKYHTILAAAATSALAVHSALMITDEGVYIKSESFRHGDE